MEVSSDLTKIAESLLDEYLDLIEKEGHSASSDLINTATSIATFDGRYFEISFNLQDYWKYLENGTKPHFPPIDAIERWIKVKKIVPKSVNGKVPTTKQLAFLISRKISREGTPATKLLEKSLSNRDVYIDKIVAILTEQLNREIMKEL